MFLDNHYIPRYHYWSGGSWKVTTQKVTAVASPYVVSDTPAMSINLPYGMQISFGPSAGSTFVTNEFHTINITHGKVKYTNLALYPSALFAGETHKYTDTRTLASQNALSMTAFTFTSKTIANVSGAISTTTGFCWSKVNGDNSWNPDVSSGTLPSLVLNFSTPVNFSDIKLATPYARGLVWSVSTNGTDFTTITPLWRSHGGTYWTFPRQTNVVAVRLTCRVPANRDLTTFELGVSQFYDYGTQDQINSARLGSSTASDGEDARGSWDTGCIGVAWNALISIDGGSCFVNTPLRGQYVWNDIDKFYTMETVPAYKYKIHPFYGFVLFEGAGLNGVSSTKSGTNFAISYFWGKRT